MPENMSKDMLLMPVFRLVTKLCLTVALTLANPIFTGICLPLSFDGHFSKIK